jgi:hypothetical protein
MQTESYFDDDLINIISQLIFEILKCDVFFEVRTELSNLKEYSISSPR